ncbi:MAG: YoaK family protein [Mycobacterium sp.]
MTAQGEQRRRWPLAVAAALAFGAGALDVVALTHLGNVFASVMTGNLALMGLGVARLDPATISHTAAAVLSYGVGVAIGARITGAHDPAGPAWPRSVTATLGVELVVLCGLAAGWMVTDGTPKGLVQMGLLVAAATSMGLQGAAMRGIGVPLATTYLTGTLTALVAARAGAPRTRGEAAGAVALVAAVAGAASSGVLLAVAPIVTPLLCVLPIAAVVGTAEFHRRTAKQLQRNEGESNE